MALGLVAAAAPAAPHAGAQSALSAAAGSQIGEQLGFSVCGVDDVDGDGIRDLAVGQPGAHNGAVTAAGRVSLVSGRTGGILATTAGSAVNGRLGEGVLRIDDVTGDGLAELMIGAPGVNGQTGAIAMFNGANLSPMPALPGPGPASRFGEHLVRLDDQDGNGIGEIAVSAAGFASGAELQAGAVLVIDPSTWNVLRQFNGTAAFDQLGTGLGTIDDMTGDGRRELVIGAPGFDPPGASGAGRVEVIDPTSGGLVRFVWGSQPGDAFGFACAGVGDVTGDAVPDFVGGAPAASPGGVTFAGTAVLVSGASSTPVAAYFGSNFSDRLGSVVAGLGDLDADGLPEYAFGSPDMNAGGKTGAGRLLVHRGGSLALLYRLDGATVGAGFGSAAAALGDVDGDLRGDFAVGSANDDGVAQNGGRVELRLGQVGDLTLSSTGKLGAPFTLSLQATPASDAFLLVDLAAGSFDSPYGKVCLAFSPVLSVLALGPEPADGVLSSAGTIPLAGIPLGTTFHLQGMVGDRNTPAGFRASDCAQIQIVP